MIETLTRIQQGGQAMTGTTAKAHLVDLPEPLRGCTGLYTHRQELIQQVAYAGTGKSSERRSISNAAGIQNVRTGSRGARESTGLSSLSISYSSLQSFLSESKATEGYRAGGLHILLVPQASMNALNA